MKKIVILGTGGTSVDILDTIADMQDNGADLKCVGFLDDNKKLWGKEIESVKVLGPLNKASSLDGVYFINGIGSPSNFINKEKIIAGLGLSPKRFLTVIHPTASVSRTARIGRGVAILQNVTVTANAKMGDHIVILPNSIVSHNCEIGDYTCIAGGVCISGGVKIGKSCYLGTNSTFRDEVKIGGLCLVGMGSVVLNDVEKKSVVVGNPARFLRKTY